MEVLNWCGRKHDGLQLICNFVRRQPAGTIRNQVTASGCFCSKNGFPLLYAQ